MNSCRDYTQSLSAYIDGALDEAGCCALEDHLQQCGDCRRELEALKCMVSVLSKLPSPEPPSLLPAIHARLFRTPVWARLFPARPSLVSRHSLALAMSVILVVVVVSLPRFLKRQTVMEEVIRQKVIESREALPVPARKDAALPLPAEQPAPPKAGGGGLLGYLSSDERKADLSAQSTLIGLGDAVSQPEPAPAGEMDHNERMVAQEAAHEERVFEGLKTLSRGKWAGGFLDDFRSKSNEATPAAGVAAPAFVGSQAYEKQAEKTPLRLKWHVANAQEAMLAVTAWVNNRQGTVSPIGKYQLSLSIPSSELPEFLRHFADESQQFPNTVDLPWVAIVLEIVPEN